MDNMTQIQTFLTRLWELEEAAGFTDADLARQMGVDQALISRAKRDNPKSVGSKFLLRAVRVFPALGFVLFPNLSAITPDVMTVKEEGAA